MIFSNSGTSHSETLMQYVGSTRLDLTLPGKGLGSEPSAPISSADPALSEIYLIISSSSKNLHRMLCINSFLAMD